MWENITKWIAWKLPKRVVMWCYIRVVAHATEGKWGKEEVTKLKAMTALERWGKDNSRESTE